MDLLLDLDTITFDQLVELGRSSIPGLDPDWTDHNVHDPGIMLMELMAWVAEAQIYSLSRMRRDERMAYARLFGVTPRLPAPARALIWPLDPDQGGEPALFAEAVVDTETTAIPDGPDPPVFRVTRPIRLTAARLQKIRTELAAGGVIDQTRANGPNGAAYQPFGASPQTDDRLVLRFQPGPGAASFTADPLAIGVEMAWAQAALGPAGSLRASLRDSSGERPVTIVADETEGMLTSGVLLLDLSANPPVDPAFDIVLRGPAGGFLVTPRVRRIATNVLPVEQIEQIQGEQMAQFGEGLPDQTYLLARSGLIDPADPKVTMIEPSGPQTWTLVPDLSQYGPTCRVFAFDRGEGELRFGNGVNGRPPPTGAALQVSYSISRGAGGAVPPKTGWRLRGFRDVFGVNEDPATGGRDADSLDDLKSLTREKLKARVASVTSADLVAAAKSEADLGVARALEAPPNVTRAPGVRVLVAKGASAAGDPQSAPESPQWLASLRRRLAPTLPLGQRLRVVPPGYVDVRIVAQLTAERGANVADVQAAAVLELADRLALDDGQGGGWKFGRGLSSVMVSGWLRAVDGVARVDRVQIYRGGVLQSRSLAIGLNELPRLVSGAGDVSVAPPGGSSA